MGFTGGDIIACCSVHPGGGNMSFDLDGLVMGRWCASLETMKGCDGFYRGARQAWASGVGVVHVMAT